MKRPSIADLTRMITNTVRLQVANSPEGKRLMAHDAIAVDALVAQIAANLVNPVDCWIDEAVESAA